ncbi:MAG: imm11 family protein [Flammeovirgaceae bacterium]
MKYYLLSHSSEKKEVGDFPQTTDKETTSIEFSSQASLTNECFPEITPALNFELTKKAKLTDVLSASNIQARGLLISEKVKTIFEKFNIMNHKFYPGTVTHKDKKLPYYWLHIVNSSFEGIDFQKSQFMEIGFTGRKVADVEVNSFEDYKNISKTKMIDAEKLVLTSGFLVNNLDLFFFPNISSYLISSERLVIELTNNNITGIRIEEAEFI